MATKASIIEGASRDDNVYFAKLAEQAERYDDMVRYLKKVAMVSTN